MTLNDDGHKWGRSSEQNCKVNSTPEIDLDLEFLIRLVDGCPFDIQGLGPYPSPITQNYETILNPDTYFLGISMIYKI